MNRIDVTQAAIRDFNKDDPEWEKPYVNWLAHYVGPVVPHDPGTCISKGEGWEFKVDSEVKNFKVTVHWCVYIDDPKLANLFAIRWL